MLNAVTSLLDFAHKEYISKEHLSCCSLWSNRLSGSLAPVDSEAAFVALSTAVNRSSVGSAPVASSVSAGAASVGALSLGSVNSWNSGSDSVSAFEGVSDAAVATLMLAGVSAGNELLDAVASLLSPLNPGGVG